MAVIVVALLILLLVGLAVGGVAALRSSVGDPEPLGQGAKGALGAKAREIDPFAVGEPWRQFVSKATRARTDFAQAVGNVEAGPKRDRLTSIGQRIDLAVDDVWSVARDGHELSKGRSRINLGETRQRLGAVTGDDETAKATRDALQSQIDSAERINAGIDQTERRLELLIARLDESVARAAELSATSSDPEAISRLDTDMTDLVDDLEALRQAVAETDHLGELGELDSGPSSETGSADTGPTTFGGETGTPATG